jgi:phosphoribosylglycinamide formyltransferase-1
MRKMPSSPLKIAALVSGSGTTLQNLLDVIAAGQLDAEISVVIGSKPGLKGLERAAAAKVMNFVVERAAFGDDVAAFSKAVFDLIDDAAVDLVCCAGWLCLLDIPDRYRGRILNIHPALLPSFGGKGMYGRRVHQAVIDHGCKVSGCTVHFVDATYDTGPIVLQRACPVLDDDTADTLAARVFEAEKIAYPEAIRLFQQGGLMIEGRRVKTRGTSRE